MKKCDRCFDGQLAPQWSKNMDDCPYCGGTGFIEEEDDYEDEEDYDPAPEATAGEKEG